MVLSTNENKNKETKTLKCCIVLDSTFEDRSFCIKDMRLHFPPL